MSNSHSAPEPPRTGPLSATSATSASKSAKKSHRGGRKRYNKRPHTTSSVDKVLLATAVAPARTPTANPLARQLIIMPSARLPSEPPSVQQPTAEALGTAPLALARTPAPAPTPTAPLKVEWRAGKSHRGCRGGRKNKKKRKNVTSNGATPTGVVAAAAAPEMQGLGGSEWWVGDELLRLLSIPV